jgi:hypothetical protein|tara:strand:+ start:252 stop:2042 length:1791 start_codon:yes stop_codon:yes gene_type:complete
MGLFSSKKTYNTTNVTGLGDEQFGSLSRDLKINNKTIKAAYDGTNKRFDTVDANTEGLASDITGVGDNVTTGFTNLTDLLGTYNEGMNKQFDSVNTGVNANNTGINDNALRVDQLSTNFDGGIDALGGRFNTVDAANTSIQGAVDQGFIDQASGFDAATTERTNNATAAQTTLTDGFSDASKALAGGFAATDKNVTDGQAGLATGQTALDTNLGTMQTNADIYAGALLANQAAIEGNQNTYKTNFDNYVERYGDDTTLANTARSNMATAQANQTDRLREDLGVFAQAAATGQTAISDQLTDTSGTLSDTVEGGFTASNELTSDALSTSDSDAITRMSNLRGYLATSGETLDATTRAQYKSLTSAFDANGELIQNSIDDQGNTISRSFTDQGMLLETKFDASGIQVGQVELDVKQMILDAETYQSQTATALQGISTGQEGLMTEIDRSQATTNNAATDLQNSLVGGFETLDVSQIKSAKNMAEIASSQTDLEMSMRQEFKQLGDAFDDGGQLIRNTIDDQGNTISRAMDDQGNLLLRSFDVTGKVIGNKVININRVLNDLGELKNVAGANTSMGNLSPAMQGNVPTGGFMSPFSQTR